MIDDETFVKENRWFLGGAIAESVVSAIVVPNKKQALRPYHV